MADSRQGARYIPTPIDTSQVCLPPDLQSLAERLAANAHDVWAARRLADGWTWGAQRDDCEKRHPDLVSYADLPESEKEYDRGSVLSTLKAMIALGYRAEATE